MNWKGQGVTKKLLQDTAYTLAEHAYEDQCTTAKSERTAYFRIERNYRNCL